MHQRARAFSHINLSFVSLVASRLFFVFMHLIQSLVGVLLVLPSDIVGQSIPYEPTNDVFAH